jgi:hypothetical protein
VEAFADTSEMEDSNADLAEPSRLSLAVSSPSLRGIGTLGNRDCL